MTAEMMRRRGIDVETDRDSVAVANTPYRPCPSDAETDWSAATFWYEIAALTAGWVTVRGPRGDELQGDRAVASLFERMVYCRNSPKKDSNCPPPPICIPDSTPTWQTCPMPCLP